MRRALAVCLRPELQLLRHDGLFSPFGPDAQSRRRILVNRRESIVSSLLVLSRALGVWSLLLVLVIAVGKRAAEPVSLFCFSGAPNVRRESRDSFLVYHLLQVSSPSFRSLL